MFTRKITLIIPTQGNPIALKRTLDSFKNIVSEIIIGSVCVFDEDEKIIQEYGNEFNLKVIKFPFNFIFKHGFSAILNELATYATNDLVLYMNCSEIVDGEERVLRLINELFWDYNCFAFDHASDPHSWFRLYDRTKIKWSGLIHEELVGERIDCPYYVFRMKDTDKDNEDLFKAKVYNDIKEIVYFNQYITLVEQPDKISTTNNYWVNFSKDSYDSLKSRLLSKSERYEAFLEGDLQKFLKAINSSSFNKEFHQSTTLVEFQGDKKSL